MHLIPRSLAIAGDVADPRRRNEAVRDIAGLLNNVGTHNWLENTFADRDSIADGAVIRIWRDKLLSNPQDAADPNRVEINTPGGWQHCLSLPVDTRGGMCLIIASCQVQATTPFGIMAGIGIDGSVDGDAVCPGGMDLSNDLLTLDVTGYAGTSIEAVGAGGAYIPTVCTLLTYLSAGQHNITTCFMRPRPYGDAPSVSQQELILIELTA